MSTGRDEHKAHLLADATSRISLKRRDFQITVEYQPISDCEPSEVTLTVLEIKTARDGADDSNSAEKLPDAHAEIERLRGELASAQEELEKAHSTIQTLKMEKTLDKRLVPEYCFCKHCDLPTRKWDGKQWICLNCDR